MTDLSAAFRGDNEYRLREDPYRRVAAETDAYVSYPSNSRAAVETLTRLGVSELINL